MKTSQTEPVKFIIPGVAAILDSLEAKTNAQRQPTFWLSPDGRWFNTTDCGCIPLIGKRQHHVVVAIALVAGFYPSESRIGDQSDSASISDALGTHYLAKDFEKILIRHGWKKGFKDTHGTPRLFVLNCVGDIGLEMTDAQYDALKEFYGDSDVFEGWTIEKLWLAQKYG